MARNSFFLFIVVFIGLLLGACQAAEEEPVSSSEGSIITPVDPTVLPDSDTELIPELGWRLFARDENSALMILEPGQDEATSIPPLGESFAPSLSPSGDQIAFWQLNGVEILTIATGETDRVGREKYGGDGNQIVWSPDGTMVAVGCVPGVSYQVSEVCLFDLANEGVQVPTNMAGYSTDPINFVDVGSWSEENNLLAFRLSFPSTQSRYFTNIIFILDMNTFETRLLLDERTQGTFTNLNFPRLSPDGTKILLSAKVDGENYEILMIEVSTGTVTQITHSPGGQDMSTPIWLDNERFTARGYSGSERISQHIYDLTGQVIGEIELPSSWRLLQIQPVE